MSIESSPDYASEAPKPAAMVAGFLRETLEERGVGAPEFIGVAQAVVPNLALQPDWFDVGPNDPRRKDSNAECNTGLAEAVRSLQAACLPENQRDGLFGPSSWAALKRRAGGVEVRRRTKRKESALMKALGLGPDLHKDPIEPLQLAPKHAYEIVPLEQGTCVVIGDSLTEKKGGMTSYLPTVEYQGGSGTNSDQALKLVKKAIADNPNVYQGKKCVIAIGGNDFSGGISTERSADNVQQMVELVRKAGGRVAVTIRMPYDEEVLTKGRGAQEAERMIQAHRDFRDGIYKMYGESEVEIIDFAQEFGRQREDGAFVLDKTGPIRVKDKKYHVHLSGKSYKLGAGFLSQALSK